MRFHVTSKATDDTAVPAWLVELEPLDRGTAQVTRHFIFDQRREGWAINGRTFDPDRDDAQPRLGSAGYRGRYVFHCHNLEHEDMAMMASFRVG
jgi:spore coat protein A, manganese oxidase